MVYGGHEYRETQNKQIKISTYLYDKWHHIQWDEKSDLDYMNQVLDWTETTKAHDDAPDSAASILREAKLAKGAKKLYGFIDKGLTKRNKCIVFLSGYLDLEGRRILVWTM